MTLLIFDPNRAEQIEKEEYLRLQWFLNHESKFRESAEKKTYNVSETDKVEMTNYQSKMVDNNDRKARLKGDDVKKVAAAVNDSNKYVGQSSSIMRPVLIDVDDLIYKKGHVAYLKKRCELLPDERYFFKETSGFEYGWKMWDCAKTMEMKRYGKSAVLRQTFYRRRAGIEQDPDWYRTPLRISPTVCNA